MSRSPKSRLSAADRTRIVLSVLAGELTGAEAARRHGVSPELVNKWKRQFLEAGESRMQDRPSGPGRGVSPEDRRLRLENEQLKLALAEATVQLRIWQRGAALVDQVPSRTSKP